MDRTAAVMNNVVETVFAPLRSLLNERHWRSATRRRRRILREGFYFIIEGTVCAYFMYMIETSKKMESVTVV